MKVQPNFKDILMFNNYDIAILFVRFGISFLYVYAAYMNSKDKAGLQWTIENTKPLFRNTKFAKNISVIKFFAYSGILIMYIGGISVLIGLEAREGSLLLLLFTVGGTIVHQRQKGDAKEMAIENSTNAQISTIAWSAFSAHFANILKNVCLIFILIFVFFNGIGKYQVCDFISRLLITK